jgi:hypothetical protein
VNKQACARCLCLSGTWLNSTMLLSYPKRRINSTIRSSSLRDALRAGLKMTISKEQDRARAAAKIAMLCTRAQGSGVITRVCYSARLSYENVLPKRRGVLISISEGALSQLYFRMIDGRDEAQSWRNATRDVARMKAS